VSPAPASDYTVRRSPRARRVWLRFDREGRLVVVVPRRFDARRVPAIVGAHSDWIERTRSRIEATRRRLQAEPAPRLPGSIVLPAVGREWKVEYRPTSSSRVAVLDRGDTLVVSGRTCDPARCRDALLRWLRRVGRSHFAGLTEQLASGNGFRPGRISVRAQRTRWASCSRKASLSLNVRLLFIGPELVRHVVVHELCHTKHMDHSRRFWVCVAHHDPEWRDHRRRLRAAWRSVPRWLDCDIPAGT